MKTGVYIRTSLAWVCLKYGIVILLASLGQACAVEFYISKVSDVPASSYSEHSGNKDLQDSLLRNAIELANQNPGPDTIEITASEPILLTSPLPALTDASTSILGIGDVVIDGSLLTAGSGFEITSANNLLDNLAIVGFPEQGIVIHGPAASGNVVRNCRVGTTGAAAAGNGICGVMIEDGASNNLITGTEHGRSIVAGNRFCGISIDDNTSVANTVQTTYIGVAADGRSALPNGDIVDGNNVVSYGVNLYHARRTLIGGPGSAYNLISSHHGWAVEICCENEGNNIVQGNRFIWDDAYPNRWRGGAGIDLVNAGENTVGGRGELGNYIDGYWEASAIVLAGEFTSWNKVVGNVLTRPRTEIEFKDFNAGIGLFSSGTSNQIGGVSAADGNVIEGRRAGVSIFGRSDRNVIRNNSIFDNRDAAIDYSNRYYPAKVMPPIVNSLSPLSGETCSCCELYVYADDADEARYPLTRLVADQDGHFEARIDSILRVSPGAFLSVSAVDEHGNTSALTGGLPIPAISQPEYEEWPAQRILGCTGSYSDVDSSEDWRISIEEVLRTIQFYSYLGYHCDSGSEDGFAPGSGERDCLTHNADYLTSDWAIDLDELMRILQFYNAGAYEPCEGSEDGFCPVFSTP